MIYKAMEMKVPEEPERLKGQPVRFTANYKGELDIFDLVKVSFCRMDYLAVVSDLFPKDKLFEAILVRDKTK